MANSTPKKPSKKAADPPRVNRLMDLLYGGPFALEDHPRGILRERDIGAAALAEKLGVQRQMVYNYVHGRSNPKPDKAKKLAKILGISMEVLERYCTPYTKT